MTGFAGLSLNQATVNKLSVAGAVDLCVRHDIPAIGPTVPLSRLIFEAPTYCYKTGVAFLAWLNGLQPRFSMLDGFERRRPAEHLVRVFELAAAAGALTDPDLAVSRMRAFLKEHA